jgi:hypothetical protein
VNFRFPHLILIVLLIAILNGCTGNLTKNVQESGTAASSNSELGGQLSCDQMVAGLESSDKAASENMGNVFSTNSQRDPRSYDVISSCLIGKLTELCSEGGPILHDSVIISEGDFDRIRNIGKTLAQMKNQDTIPILIDCSDRERELGGISPSSYPALDPLLHFGDDAIPFLLKKYEDADSAKKCRIGSILSMMRSPKASQNLKKLLTAEKDLNVRKCLIASRRAYSS